FAPKSPALRYASQGVFQFAYRLPALRRIALQALPQNRFERSGFNRTPVFGNRPAHQHFVQEGAERTDVGAWALLSSGFGAAPIQQIDALVRHQNIRGRQAAMDNAALVRI